jgi:predicted phage terminase large subunit-like protein
VGVDENSNIDVLSDSYWRAAATDVVVDEMIKLIRRHKPLFWWAERGQISKAIGPFLRKRMDEERTYCSVVEMTPTVDKQARAQSIQARVAMNKVFFPAHASWWPEARDQLLKFPNAAHDDFVDALAYIGLGLSQQASASRVSVASFVKPGTFAALKAETERREQALRLRSQNRDW